MTVPSVGLDVHGKETVMREWEGVRVCGDTAGAGDDGAIDSATRSDLGTGAGDLISEAKYAGVVLASDNHGNDPAIRRWCLKP